MSTLRVLNIQRFCLHDGPGIRTTVFLKGCPLHCTWCSNPESQNFFPQLMQDAQKCTGCGGCAAACLHGAVVLETGGRPRFFREHCQLCGRCVDACPTGALSLCGEEKSVAEILALVLRDRAYYRQSGGGLTVSGGEPFSQAHGLLRLLSAAKEQGLHTAVETCADVPLQQFMSVFDLLDLYLIDIKHTDADLLRLHTGGCLERIMGNLAAAAARDPRKVMLRMPVIPGVNHQEDVIRGVFHLALRYGVEQVRLLPYHTLGAGKYAALGKEYALDAAMLTKADLLPYQKTGQELGLQVGIGG